MIQTNPLKKYGLSFAVFLISFATFSTVAHAGFFDFWHGRLAKPGTELHSLGNHALSEGKNGYSYFTNGKGRILEVLAKDVNGDLRVVLKRVYFPPNYIADTPSERMEVRSLMAQLKGHVRTGNQVAGYTVLPYDDGLAIYSAAAHIEAERNRNRNIDAN